MMRRFGEPARGLSRLHHPVSVSALLMLLSVAIVAACAESPDLDEAELRVRQACGESGPDLDTTVAALLAVREHATAEERQLADRHMELAHHVMLDEAQTYPRREYNEALMAHPRFYVLLGMANGNLRTANRLDAENARKYLSLSACLFRLTQRFETQAQELAEEPEHFRTSITSGVESTLECVESKLEAVLRGGPYCFEVHDPSLPPMIAERRLKEAAQESHRRD